MDETPGLACHPRKKKFASRSRAGCVTCRRRRKRCDEGKPTCANCHRVNVPCEWAAPTLFKQRRNTEVEPLLAVNNAWDCTQLTSREQPSARLSPPVPAVQPLAGALSYALSPNPSMTAEQRQLITYYIHTLVPTYTVFTTSTTYHVSLYIPMAFYSPGVLQAILARASSHLAKTDIEPDRVAHFTQLSRMHQLLCHQYLQQCISNTGDPSSSSDEIMATVMLLIALETQEGTKNEKYMKQLQSARRIVANRGGPRHFIDAGWEAQCVFGHFLYHEAMRSIMNDVYQGMNVDISTSLTLAADDDNSMAMDWDVNFSDLGPRIDPLMGLATSLFLKIRQISLVKRCPIGSIERNMAFLSLEHGITEWCVQEDYAVGKPVNGLDLAAQMDLISLAETYRLAALILLYRTSAMHQSNLPKLATQIMAFISRIPVGNPVEAGMLLPIFLAGGELLEWHEIEACTLRMRSMHDRIKFRNIEEILEVLERVWRSRLNGAEKDWVQVLREEHRFIHVA